MCLGLGYDPMGVCEESIFFHPGGWGAEGDTHATPELIFMFPQIGATEAPKDQVIIQVVPGFQDRHVTKDTTFRLQDVVCLGPHLPTNPDNDPHPFFLVP